MGQQFLPAEATLSGQLIGAFETTLGRTERLFDLLTEDAYWMRPIPLRHPINFYEGHLPAFIWNTVFRRTLKEPSFNPEFDRLFERGIDPMDQPAADALSIRRWPDRAVVQAYKRRVHQRLFDFLAGDDRFLRGNEAVLRLVLEHEMMHQETLLYMLHQLPPRHKRRPGDKEASSQVKRVPVKPYRVDIPAGLAHLGAEDGKFPFAWDNETPSGAVAVDAFSIDAFKVTNGQFLEFLEAGGYDNPAFWTRESWQWKTEHYRRQPAFWLRNVSQWLLRDFFEDVPLPLDAPVYVTHAEAQAYARFRGQDLPTEAEWHRAAFGDGQSAYPWGDEAPTPAHGNFDFKHWSSVPVGQFPQGVSQSGVHELTGNGWEWTSTLFEPFPGFTPSRAYPQYSADFFDGQHFVVKGGSCFTDARLLRRSFRNWFYWHYPYAYTTFRCVTREPVNW